MNRLFLGVFSIVCLITNSRAESDTTLRALIRAIEQAPVYDAAKVKRIATIRQTIYTGNNTASTVTFARYEQCANLNNLTWKATLTTWGIIGDATPGGWNSDTQMTYDATNQVWTVTAVMKQAGSFKFRANNAWVIDFGIDSKGNLQYADNPLFPYNPNLNNLTVPADGTYVITLDLHVSGKYTYTAVKQ